MYGGIAARAAGVPHLVIAVSGLGFAFTEGAGIVRAVASAVARVLARAAFAHPRKRVIVQNVDDARLLRELGLATDAELLLIPGSGVELERFVHAPVHAKEPLVLLPARMLRDKGVVEFVEAARTVRARHPTWRFVLAGGAGHDNPSALERDELEAWGREGPVEWIGHVDDIAPWMARASIVCLPSYREGMPKSLLEAAAAACAVVTCDTVGCREAIKPGETGDLVPVRDAVTLAQTLDALIADDDRRQRYGLAGRRMAQERFGLDAVVESTFELYRRLSTLPRSP
jgi:glycosyltransferase involved in cell wall biosynthesis